MSESAIRLEEVVSERENFLAEVLHGLSIFPKSLSPKFFYDRRGSELFEQICLLPEYYLTRTEIEILRACGEEIAEIVGPASVLIELGSGASHKVRMLLEMLRPRTYIGVDISREFLLDATRRLAKDFPAIEVRAHCADLHQPLTLECPPGKRLAFYPGSSIGNFNPQEALKLLQNIRALLGSDGLLLIGVDLKKDPKILHAAYNDAAEITAAFNLNLLHRLQHELGAELDIAGFRHEAFYNAARGRIEMHLESLRAQVIRIGSQTFSFAAGERLHTENSYKYTLAEFQQLARSAGFEPIREWVDEQALFSVHCLGVAEK